MRHKIIWVMCTGDKECAKMLRTAVHKLSVEQVAGLVLDMLAALVEEVWQN